MAQDTDGSGQNRPVQDRMVDGDSEDSLEEEGKSVTRSSKQRIKKPQLYGEWKFARMKKEGEESK